MSIYLETTKNFKLAVDKFRADPSFFSGCGLSRTERKNLQRFSTLSDAQIDQTGLLIEAIAQRTLDLSPYAELTRTLRNTLSFTLSQRWKLRKAPAILGTLVWELFLAIPKKVADAGKVLCLEENFPRFGSWRPSSMARWLSPGYERLSYPTID